MFFHLLTFFDLKNIHAAGIIDQSIFIIDLSINVGLPFYGRSFKKFGGIKKSY